MARQAIFLGVVPNDGTGTVLRVGGDKINSNFIELYRGAVAVNDSPPAPDEGHLLIYPHSDGRILAKDHNGQVVQIDRHIILNNADEVQPRKLYLKFGTNFTVTEVGNALVISISGTALPVHDNDHHNEAYATEQALSDHLTDENAHGDLLHGQNTDQYLDLGGSFEISAETLFNIAQGFQKVEKIVPEDINGWIYPPVDEIVTSYPGSPSEGDRVIYSDNKIYEYTGGSWVVDPITSNLSLIDGYLVHIYNPPIGINRHFIYNNTLSEWVDITDTIDLELGRFQTIYDATEKRIARPFYGTDLNNLNESGKYTLFENVTNIPTLNGNDASLALVDCISQGGDYAFYYYHRLSTNEIYYRSKHNGAFSNWKKISEQQTETKGLIKTTVTEFNVNLDNDTYLADTTSNHVKFVLPNPTNCENKVFQFRHIKGTNTMTIERSVGDIYWNDSACSLISSEGDKGFWFTIKSDGTDFHIISDSGILIGNVLEI